MLDINKDIIYFAAYFLLHALIAWRLGSYLDRRKSKKIMLMVMALGFLAMALQLGLPGGLWQGMVLLAGCMLPLEWALQRMLKERYHSTVLLCLLIILLFTAMIAWMNGRALPVPRQQTLTLSEWQARRPHRLIHVSDLHLGSGDVGRLRSIVGMINSLNADWVVITGDLTVGKDWPDELPDIFQGLYSRHGVYAVRGNHEIKGGGIEAFTEFCKRSDIRPLINESVETRGLVLAGVDEAILKSFRKEKAMWNLPGGDLEKALQGILPNRPIVLLAHRSSWAYKAERAGVDLMLCGHTHGGQLPPISWLLAALDHFAGGDYQVGSMQLKVSEGAGVWNYLPMRLFTNNTIHEILIRPAGNE